MAPGGLMIDAALFLAMTALTMIGYFTGREVERDEQRRRLERRRAHQHQTTNNNRRTNP
jgi:hypothetical protein